MASTIQVQGRGKDVGGSGIGRLTATKVTRAERVRSWIDGNYKMIMLAGMLVEILLIAYLCVRA